MVKAECARSPGASAGSARLPIGFARTTTVAVATGTNLRTAPGFARWTTETVAARPNRTGALTRMFQ